MEIVLQINTVLSTRPQEQPLKSGFWSMQETSIPRPSLQSQGARGTAGTAKVAIDYGFENHDWVGFFLKMI